MNKLILVLGDQLSDDLASLRQYQQGDLVLMAEVMDEATYSPHHKKKLALVFSAMRHFAKRLQKAGIKVRYRTLDNTAASLEAEVALALQATGLGAVLLTEPGEWRLLDVMTNWQERLQVPVTILDDDRFFVSRQQFSRWAEGRKAWRMEHFYRAQRRATGILMAGNEPVGGKWNYDHDNRQGFNDTVPPRPTLPTCPPDTITEAVLALVESRFADHMGTLRPFDFPVTRAQAEAELAHFIAYRLPHFGNWQDAMAVGEDWLFHSRLSPLINLGLLSPREACQAAEAAYHAGTAPLNAVEGFIRQILGWREYVRGVYWTQMPDYKNKNALASHRPLPDLYWTGKTRMRCMAEALRNSLDNGYAHHIQRLMITGNFALIAGLSVKDICNWYLAVYLDAYEWVELPNTLGMVMHADHGLMASKPYAASGKYIQRMSNYCEHCSFDVKQLTGAKACPFNAFYWHFLLRNRANLENNPRMAMPYRTLARWGAPKLEAIEQQAQSLWRRLDNGEL
ncbi:cryptochrome/photolyase family protein [Gallaecimonas sp. GXIMD1310]|uniref:cryptochrome/photolyase family protein n=1 Tax=Gallaecimonas sp. GXIMD1310 TaxID=3131926 RepID=UPI0032523A6B